MKKIMIIFTVVVSFFVFNITFKTTSFNLYIRERELGFNIVNHTDLKATIMEFNIENHKQDVIKKITEFLNENKYIAYVMKSVENSNFNVENNFYLYAQDKDFVESLYTIKEGNTIDFMSSLEEYYTTDLNDKNTNYHIHYLNKNYHKKQYGVVKIHPFQNVLNSIKSDSETLLYVNFLVPNIEKFNKTIQASSLHTYINNYDAGEVHSTLDETIDISLTLKMISIIGLSLLLLSACYVFRERQEIILRKMQGMSDIYILRRLFLFPIGFVLLTYFATQILCYSFWIGNFYDNSIAFIYTLAQYFLYFILCICIVVIILYFIVRYWININYLKRESGNRKLLIFNTVLKVMALVLLMQPVILEMKQVFNNTKLYFLLQEDKNMYRNSIYLSGINGDAPEKIHQYEELVNNYFNNHGGYYQNFDSYYFSKIKEFNQMLPPYPFPYLEANINYLSEYSLFYEDGSRVHLDQLENETLLIPIKYKGKDVSLYDGHPIIYIENGSEFKRKTLQDDYQTYYLSDPIIKVYKNIPMDNPMKGPYSIIFPITDANSIPEFKDYLKENHLQDKVMFKNNVNDFEIVSNAIKDRAIQGWCMLSVQIIVILLFLFETIYVIILQEKKTYALRYLQGSSYLERYASLYLMNFCIYVIVGITGILMQLEIISLFQYLLFFLVFESCITYVLIRRFEKKSIVVCLKGE